MMQPTPAPPAGELAPPRGVGLTALALGVLISFYFIRSLLQLAGEPHAARPIFEPLLLCGAHVIELLLIWQYWKGRDYARVFVLLWSLLTAAQAIAFLVDHNLDPAALMSRPLSFFHALLAVFLLYWLNTPPLRAWFKKTSSTAADLIAPSLVGKLCTALEFSATNSHPAWYLTFEHGASLTLSCPFRIVLDDNLAFISASLPSHHVPPTAVPDPSTDPGDARRLLQNLRVTAVRLAPRTSDLFLSFEMGIELQTWSLEPSALAPLWQYSDPGLTVIARADGVSSQPVASSSEPPAND